MTLISVVMKVYAKPSIMINNVDINEELTKEEILDKKAQARFLRALLLLVTT